MVFISTDKIESSKRGARVNGLRVGCIALTHEPDLDNANVGNCFCMFRTCSLRHVLFLLR